MQITTIREHSFFTDPLQNGRAFVLDAGCHRGDFAQAVAARFADSTVCALEPVPELFEQIPASPARGGSIRKFPLALAAASGEHTFHLGKNPEANSLRPLRSAAHLATVTVRGVSLPDFLAEQQLERVDLLKLDIEGAEIELLLNLEETTLGKVSQITAEFHAHTNELSHEEGTGGLGANAELGRIREVIARLRRDGFICINRSAPFYIDVLFVNCARLRLSAVRAAWLQLRHEHWYRAVNTLRRRGWLPQADGSRG